MKRIRTEIIKEEFKSIDKVGIKPNSSHLFSQSPPSLCGFLFCTERDVGEEGYRQEESRE